MLAIISQPALSLSVSALKLLARRHCETMTPRRLPQRQRNSSAQFAKRASNKQSRLLELELAFRAPYRARCPRARQNCKNFDVGQVMPSWKGIDTGNALLY